MSERPINHQVLYNSTIFECSTKLPDGTFSPGTYLTQKLSPPSPPPTTTLALSNHPFIDSPPHIFQLRLPPSDTPLGITIKECNYHGLPYISSSSHGSPFQQVVTDELRHNILILAISNNPITVD